jgi:hypothetical protein
LKTRILIACFSFCICFGSVFAVSQTSSFQSLQKPGPYTVGLKVVDHYDYSRAYPASSKNLSKSSVGDDARPLQTLIWYPSLRSTGKPMTVGDYTQLADTEIHFDAPRPEQNRWRSLLKTSSEIPLWTVRDAKPAKGHYPVLIYAPSDSSVSWENTDLCEYLASHGYVILASPSMGVSRRDMTNDLDGINAEARDISFLSGPGRWQLSTQRPRGSRPHKPHGPGEQRGLLRRSPSLQLGLRNRAGPSDAPADRESVAMSCV